MDCREILREALREVESFTGRRGLRLIIERIIYDLSLTKPELRNLEIPDNPAEIDLSNLSDDEVRKFYYLLADISGTVVGDFLKEKLLRRFDGS